MSDLIQSITSLFSGLLQDSPWWLYVLVAAIPISMVLAAREGFCWFWKQNNLIKKLDRIDKKLEKLIDILEPKVKKESSSKKKKIEEEKFTLEEENFKLK